MVSILCRLLVILYSELQARQSDYSCIYDTFMCRSFDCLFGLRSYQCDEFVINDTPSRHVERLRQLIADRQERNRRRRMARKSEEEPARKKSAGMNVCPYYND